MHCLDPACVSVCPVGALVKLKEGPVVYNDERCIGCRYCMMACPFQVPKFQWESAVPLVRKCDFCADRLALGLAPACTTTCPTGTLLFGERARPAERSPPPPGGPPGALLPPGLRGEHRGGHLVALPHPGLLRRSWVWTTGASAPTWATSPTASTAGSGCPRCPSWVWPWGAWPWGSITSTSAGRKLSPRTSPRRTEPWP